MTEENLESAMDSLQMTYDFDTDKIKLQSKDLGKDGKPLLEFTIDKEPAAPLATESQPPATEESVVVVDTTETK